MPSTSGDHLPFAPMRQFSLDITEQERSHLGQSTPLQPVTRFVEHIGGVPLVAADRSIRIEVVQTGPARSDTLPSYFSERLPSYALATTGTSRSPLRRQTESQIDDPPSKCKKLLMMGILFAPLWVVGLAIYGFHRFEETALSWRILPPRLRCSDDDHKRHQLELLWGRKCAYAITILLSFAVGVVLLVTIVNDFNKGGSHSS